MKEAEYGSGPLDDILNLGRTSDRFNFGVNKTSLEGESCIGFKTFLLVCATSLLLAMADDLGKHPLIQSIRDTLGG